MSDKTEVTLYQSLGIATGSKYWKWRIGNETSTLFYTKWGAKRSARKYLAGRANSDGLKSETHYL